MADIVDSETRSRMMSGIRSKNTKPEILVRQALHARGFRFRLHDKRLPGKPDIYLPKYKAVIQINGCFWHMHGCHLFKLPGSNTGVWQEKLKKNRERDEATQQKLLDKGLSLAVVWECALKGKLADSERVINRLEHWLRVSDTSILELSGEALRKEPEMH